jgi:hypothetical protein
VACRISSCNLEARLSSKRCNEGACTHCAVATAATTQQSHACWYTTSSYPESTLSTSSKKAPANTATDPATIASNTGERIFGRWAPHCSILESRGACSGARETGDVGANQGANQATQSNQIRPCKFIFPKATISVESS